MNDEYKWKPVRTSESKDIADYIRDAFNPRPDQNIVDRLVNVAVLVGIGVVVVKLGMMAFGLATIVPWWRY